MVDHSLLSITLKGKTRKLQPYLVSVYGVPSLGIQSPSSSLVLLMGTVPNVGGLIPLRSRPYQPESVSDQPAPWTLPLPDSVSRVPSQTHTVPVWPWSHCWALPSTQADFLHSGAGHTRRSASLSGFCYLGPFPRPTPSYLIPGPTVGP